MRGNSHVQFLGGGVRSNAVLLPDQTVLTKAKFIAQVMSGDKGLRSIEDVELATLSYAEVKALASGNPKVIEKAGVDADIARYSSLFMVWRNQRYANESEVAHLPMRIDSSEKLLRALANDADAATSLLQTGELVATVHGRSHRGPEGVGDALRTVIRMARGRLAAVRDRELGVFARARALAARLQPALAEPPPPVHRAAGGVLFSEHQQAHFSWISASRRRGSFRRRQVQACSRCLDRRSPARQEA